MSAPRVVAVVQDGWIARLVEEGLRDGGFVVTASKSANDALAKVRELGPDAILCDAWLEGVDGYAFVASVRAEPPPASITPIALIAPEDDPTARTRAFEAGADVFILRPFRLDELTAQIHALVQLARRMRERRASLVDSLRAPPPAAAAPETATFKGDLEHMPLDSLLAILEVERKSGTVVVTSGRHVVTIDLADGCIAASTSDSKACDPVLALKTVLAWKEGRVVFRVGPSISRPASARPVRALIAQATNAATGPIGPSRSASVARMAAIPPPPGRRKASPSGLMPKVTENMTPRAPALEPQDTRRVGEPPREPTPETPRETPTTPTATRRPR